MESFKPLFRFPFSTKKAQALSTRSSMLVSTPTALQRGVCSSPSRISRWRIARSPRAAAAAGGNNKGDDASTSSLGRSIPHDTDWRAKAKPVQPGSSYPAKEHCSQCGLCDTYYVAHVKEACAFLGEGAKERRRRNSAWVFCPSFFDRDPLL